MRLYVFTDNPSVMIIHSWSFGNYGYVIDSVFDNIDNDLLGIAYDFDIVEVNRMKGLYKKL